MRPSMAQGPLLAAEGAACGAPRATACGASGAASASASVLNQPKPKRIVPSGNVPSVRCAAGAQWRPVRAMTANDRSRISPTSDGVAPATVNDTVPHLSAGSDGPYVV